MGGLVYDIMLILLNISKYDRTRNVRSNWLIIGSPR